MKRSMKYEYLKRRLSNIFFVVILGLILRLFFFVIFVLPQPSRSVLNIDAQGYERLALNLLNGDGFTVSQNKPFVPEFLRTPGYPFFIAGIYKLFGPKPEAVVFIQIFLDVASVVLLYFIASIVGSEKTALLAAGLRAFDPSAIALSCSLMSETLFVSLLLLSLYFIHRFIAVKNLNLTSAFSLGFTSACLSYVRPVGVYFGIMITILVLIIFWRVAPKLLLARFLLLYVTIFGLLLSPWIYRNYVLTYGIFFSTSPSYNLLFQNAIYVESAVKGLEPERIFLEKEKFFKNLSSLKELNQYQVSAAMRDTALSILVSNWRESLILFLKGVVVRFIAPHRQEYGNLLYGKFYVSGSSGVLYTSGFKESIERFIESPGGIIAGFESLFNLILLFFAFWGITYGAKSKLRIVCIVNLMLILYFIIIPGMLIIGRMRAPAMPSIDLVSAVGVASIYRKMKTKGK